MQIKLWCPKLPDHCQTTAPWTRRFIKLTLIMTTPDTWIAFALNAFGLHWRQPITISSNVAFSVWEEKEPNLQPRIKKWQWAEKVTNFWNAFIRFHILRDKAKREEVQDTRLSETVCKEVLRLSSGSPTFQIQIQNSFGTFGKTWHLQKHPLWMSHPVRGKWLRCKEDRGAEQEGAGEAREEKSLWWIVLLVRQPCNIFGQESDSPRFFVLLESFSLFFVFFFLPPNISFCHHKRALAVTTLPAVIPNDTACRN